MQNIIPPIPQSDQKPDGRVSNDAKGDWLDLLRTAGIFVGAFVSVSNMLSIKSLHVKAFAQQSQQIQQRVWTVCICEDNAGNGDPLPAVPLANCKACRKEKTYGASYNAADHLQCESSSIPAPSVVDSAEPEKIWPWKKDDKSGRRIGPQACVPMVSPFPCQSLR